MLSATVAQANDFAVIDPQEFPESFIGQWGTSKKNCENEDDYGPLIVREDGFSHCEVSSASLYVKKIGGSYRVSYSMLDIASEEIEIRKEIWILSPDSSTLQIRDGAEVSLYSRCERIN